MTRTDSLNRAAWTLLEKWHDTFRTGGSFGECFRSTEVLLDRKRREDSEREERPPRVQGWSA